MDTLHTNLEEKEGYFKNLWKNNEKPKLKIQEQTSLRTDNVLDIFIFTYLYKLRFYFSNCSSK